jgi:type III secretion system FlhB-like substrate exporter
MQTGAKMMTYQNTDSDALREKAANLLLEEAMQSDKPLYRLVEDIEKLEALNFAEDVEPEIFESADQILGFLAELEEKAKNDLLDGESDA